MHSKLAADWVDLWTSDGSNRDFTVVLRDNRTIKVMGCGLKHLKSEGSHGDLGSYAVMAQGGDSEVTVALFRIADVTGIFQGELRLSQDGA